jgi:exonuclease VII small subunit
MPILTLIPLETKIATLFLVILPAIAVFLLRLSLHKKLQEINNRISRLLVGGKEEGIQPEIVKRLRTRYQNASQKLEHVNTLALIDSIYKDEQLRFSSFKIQFDRADAITRALPNLLIAFGLIGTFLGITSNLTNISEIVTGFSDSNQNISGLVQKLQSPLQDMGIAFSSSLFGLFFGSILTIANTILNTSIAKNQLISSLEDYLDNIYKPTVEGNTRLDTAIDRMVKQQQEFLTRFHENVGAALERSFGKAANQIAEECGRINQIAENVYTNFSNAAGTISTGATRFQQAANSLESQTKNLADYLYEFKSGVETFRVSAERLEKNNIVQNLDRVLAELNTSQQAFTNSTHTLENSLEGITSSNQTAAELAEKVYQSLHTSISSMDNASTTIERSANTFSIAVTSMETHAQSFAFFVPGIQKSAKTFETTANKLEQNNIIQNLDRVLAEFNTTQTAFTHSTQTLQGSLEGITTSNQTAAQLAQSVYKTWQASTNKIDAASEMINNGAILFQQATTSLQGQTQTLVGLVPQLQTGISDFVSAANKVKTNNIIKNLNTLVTNLTTTQAEFTNSTQTLAVGVEGMMSSHQQANQVINQVYQGLATTTSSLQAGANNLVSAAQIIRDSLLAIDLNNAANKWQNTQTEFANSTAIFSQASKNLQPVTAKLEPAIASIDRAVNSLQQVGSEVVSLSRNNVQVSESTQTALDGFNRNYLKVLNNTDLSIQDLGMTNRSNWQSLVNILEPKIQTDRESLQRLLIVIERLEKIVSNIDATNIRDRSSGLQGLSQSN